MKYSFLFSILIFVLFISCNKSETEAPPIIDLEIISAVDISSFPEIDLTNPVFFDLDDTPKGFLTILKNSGVNTIRLRLWVNPQNNHSSFEEVKQFAQILRTYNFKIWLTLHYSDTWADPGNQEIPAQWQGIPFEDLKDSVDVYTKKVVHQIDPDLIQVGNEINPGFLHPYGNINSNPERFKELLNTAINAVRTNSTNAKIIIHYAGLSGSDWFYNQLDSIDYDIIGLSYYPIWHGKSLGDLKSKLTQLSEAHNKDILIAETAYPFTLDWNDWTNNIVGLEGQLILPNFPATEEGQRNFINSIKNISTKDVTRGVGFCYWGAELIAWKGTQATDGSPWENQSLFDFENKALPVIEEFKTE
ncbi:MAG: glycosyl hydrolase 53 family protein [Flavobacteriaceae bacterium]